LDKLAAQCGELFFWVFMRSLLLPVVLAILGTAAGRSSAGAYAVGEKIRCQAYFMGVVPIGTVWMESSTGSYAGVPTYEFNGRCYGKVLFYTADVRVKSHLSRFTDQSLYHEIEQYGSERRGRHLLFDWPGGKVDYVRRERDGTYKLRRSVPVGPDVWDVFGAAFYARNKIDLTLGVTNEIKVIETEKVFHLGCIPVERRPFFVKDFGTFDAVRVKFCALNLAPDEIFKGLLDLDRDIVVWIDVSSRTPIYMSSAVPFGIVRPWIEVHLKEWVTAPGFEPHLLAPDPDADGSALVTAHAE
jgi:hypothetical protein